MIPQIDTAEQARAAVSAAKFSPVGTRGTCRFVRSAGLRRRPRQRVFLQGPGYRRHSAGRGPAAPWRIWTRFMAVPGVDVVFVGPYDLSSSLGTCGRDRPPGGGRLHQGDHPPRARTPRASRSAASPTPWRAASSWRDLGVKFIGYSCDTYLFMQAAKADVEKFGK